MSDFVENETAYIFTSRKLTKIRHKATLIGVALTRESNKKLRGFDNMKNVQFTHVSLGKNKNVAIAHIYKMDDATKIHEYAVVRYPDLDPNSEYYGTWSHSLGYYSDYDDALQKFYDYLQK